MSLLKGTTTYYDRCMDQNLIDRITKDYPWLIDYVKSKPELDFQTGHDLRNDKSWFSVYRGTGRVLTITSNSKKLQVADAYKILMPSSFFVAPTASSFDEYLEKIRKTPKLERYYADETTAKRKEGYYQNLISRRYSFQTTKDDDFIIIDKEFVLGFYSDAIKKEWCDDIIKEQEAKIGELRKQLRRAPRNIKPQYGEFDFLALNWEGDIIIMELKQQDSQKTYLSPVQVGYYYRQFVKLIKEDDGSLYKNIKRMVEQKIELGLIALPEGKVLPKKLSGNLKACVIVGEDSFSKEVTKRYGIARSVFLPEMGAFTCTKDGTLVPSKLNNK